MKIEISAKNYEVRDALNDVLVKKITRLSKYFTDDAVTKVALQKANSGQHKMEIVISYKGNYMRSAGTGDNFYDLIDLLLPKIESQIYKYKTKLQKKLKEDAFKEKQLFSEKAYNEKESKLVKTKRFPLNTLSVEEAISEMELLSHSFYVYIDKTSKKVNVIYRRDDGDIGLIDPII